MPKSTHSSAARRCSKTTSGKSTSATLASGVKKRPAAATGKRTEHGHLHWKSWIREDKGPRECAVLCKTERGRKLWQLKRQTKSALCVSHTQFGDRGHALALELKSCSTLATAFGSCWPQNASHCLLSVRTWHKTHEVADSCGAARVSFGMFKGTYMLGLRGAASMREQNLAMCFEMF